MKTASHLQTASARRFGAALVALLPMLALLVGCTAPAPTDRQIVVTIPPLAMIVQELVGDAIAVHTLAPGGASPHTFEPRPSDARAAQDALVLLYVSESLDAWAARMEAPRKMGVFEMIPHKHHLGWDDATHVGHDHAHDHDGDHDHEHDHAHDHGDKDPHFWSDPQVVSALLPALSDLLAEVHPESAAPVAANAARFTEELNALDEDLGHMMAPVAGRPVVLFHPSWRYFLQRYGLPVAAVVEPAPGKEPSPQYVEEVLEAIRGQEVRAVFTEPQLPEAPARAIAESAGIPLAEIDPLGGTAGRNTYADLLHHNAQVMVEALQ